MAKTINLEIITPSKRFYKGDVELVIVRTLEGEEGYMANHSWACKLLAVGEMWIQEPGAKDFKVAAITGGYVDVQDSIIIYTDDALWAEEIDEARAESDKAEAEEMLTHVEDFDPRDVERAKISISKAIVRLNVKHGGARRKR